jgi:hypothetical protein
MGSDQSAESKFAIGLPNRNGKADFPDYFIASINAELGCDTLTFGRPALDFEEFSAVP